MIKKLIQRTISVILVIAMIFEVGTPLAYAAGLDGEEQAEQDYLEEYDGSDVVFDADTAALLNSTNDKGATLKASDATVAGESVKRRDEHIKGYRLSDGSDAVFLYPFAVNEKDSQDNWVEIDNRLIIEQDKDGNLKRTGLYKEGVIEWQ